MLHWTEYLPYCYDALAVIVLLSSIYSASQRGFAATLVNFLGYLAAVGGAWALAGALAPPLFQNVLRGPLIEKAEEILTQLTGGVDIPGAALHFLESLPALTRSLLGAGGLSLGALEEALQQYAASSAQTLVDSALAPALTGMVTSLLFLVLFSVLMLLVRAITRFFLGVRNIPLIGPLNSILGGVLGLATGAVCVGVLFMILRFAATLTADSMDFLNNQILQSTFTIRLLHRFTPFF